MVARSVDRVVSQSDPAIDERIRRQSEMSVCYYQSHPEQIEERLRELDLEWDTDRALEAVSSGLSLMGFTWGLFRKRWWLVGLAVQGFFFQYAVQGSSPTIRLIRRFGFRTAHEIDTERFALLALLGERRGSATGAENRESGRPPADQPMGASAFQPI